jgi:hypothetical protein
MWVEWLAAVVAGDDRREVVTALEMFEDQRFLVP